MTPDEGSYLTELLYKDVPEKLISVKELIKCFWSNAIYYSNALLLLVWSNCGFSVPKSNQRMLGGVP